MHINYMLRIFEEKKQNDAIVWNDKIYTYQWLLNRFKSWKEEIHSRNIPKGAITVIEGDYSPESIALFLALADSSCIIVPLTDSSEVQKEEFIKIAQGEYSFLIDEKDRVEIKRLPHSADHELYTKLRHTKKVPGLVLFSSGSTGQSKASVHDLNLILKKFKTGGRLFRSILFLLYDHIGGINTMLYNLFNAGCLLTVRARTPDEILRTVEKYKAELLPTSPTFINLILLSEAYKKYDMSSLKMVSYGTEPMPESTLKRLHELLPDVELRQTYGLSEVGILSSKSKSSNSLWVKIGGEGFAIRVVDNTLQIKSQSAMLGYLNAQSPFTEDGWFDTGDQVITDGEYFKILGRKSEIINVGGEKVYPSEIESVIQDIDNVAQVTVYGRKNAITGNIVCARISLLSPEDPSNFKLRLKMYCKSKLEPYKIPIKIKIVEEKQHTPRFKKNRNLNF